jgi:DNA-binding IclR family transcriptional regulator
LLQWGVTALDARAKIARLVEANPRITVAELVRRTRVSRQRVHQLLELMGYEQDCVWRRPSPEQEET